MIQKIKNFIKSITRYRFIDIISPIRWKHFTVSLLRKSINFLEGEDANVYEEVHIIEQYMFRMIKCSDCLSAGQCKHCHCSLPDKMFVRKDQCSMGKWGKFMNKTEWEAFKQKFNINFKLSINDKLY